MATLTCYCSCPSKSSLSLLHKSPNPQLFTKNPSILSISTNPKWIHRASTILQCSDFNLSSVTMSAETEEVTLSESDFETESESEEVALSESEFETETETETEEEEGGGGGDGVTSVSLAPVKKKRRRYRKQYPGEKKGITEEMRFVTMKLRNSKVKGKSESDDEVKADCRSNGYESDLSETDDSDGGEGRTWQPSIEGFIKYLVDSKLVFSTIERIVDESSDVSYVYFRRTGLERAGCISKDLEWFSQQGHLIPEPSNYGVSYADYLEKLAEKNTPLFLCHFYNIYFSHIAGGQVIAKKAFEKLVEEKELEFYKWEGDAEELMRGLRENLNMLAKHWSRYDKNKCLRETTKVFRFMGQIIRLIIIV